LHNVTVISRNFQDRRLKLQNMFLRFREDRLKLNPGKCRLVPKGVRNLGHTVSPGRIGMTNTEEWDRNCKVSGHVPILWTVCSRIRQCRIPLTKLTEQKQSIQ
jgi:hypothetical protein